MLIVIKFSDSRAAFRGGKRQFIFNDPLSVGVVFDEMDQNVTWAKVRLRTSEVAFEELSSAPAGVVSIGLRSQPRPPKPALENLRLGLHQAASRLVLDLSDPVKFEGTPVDSQYLIRLKNTQLKLTEQPKAQDDRIRILAVEQDGEDVQVRILLKQHQLQISSLTLASPERVVFNFLSLLQPGITTEPAEKEEAETATTPLPRPSAGGLALDAMLEDEKNPLVRANFVLAERNFREGNYPRANRLFLRVFTTAPVSPLGIQAYFRAADSQFERLSLTNSQNFHSVITTYESALRAAEDANFQSDLVPRAFYQIARAFQKMDFHRESNVNFQILQERFPGNVPYSLDSFYYTGENHVAMREFDKAIPAFHRFLDEGGDPALQAAAHYNLGDAFYNLGDYLTSKREFDRARRLEPDYPLTHPLLLFHMGESYYENSEFEIARLIYRQLLERYPERTFTQLVALRLGDFLRDETKEPEALEVYRRIMAVAPSGIRLRAMMRIADLLAKHPAGDDFKQALVLYQRIIAEGENDPIVEEALLRRALTQTLHQQNQEAIATFETLVATYPESPFIRGNIIRFNIEENLKQLIDRRFSKKDYWEVAKAFRQYRERYFVNFEHKFTYFQVAWAYQHLGLYAEAVGLYEQVEAEGAASLGPLVRYQMALAYAEKDDLGKAEETLLRFIQDFEKDEYMTDVRQRLGEVYFTGRRYEEALNAYRILVQEFEESKSPELEESIAEIYHRLGLIYKELGQLKNAQEAFDKSIANFHHPLVGPDVPAYIILSQFLAGDMLFEIGQDSEALAAYERVTGRYPAHEKSPWAQYQMGLIYRRRGEDRKALETFSELVDLAKLKPGELWESLARENQRDLVNQLQFKDYLQQ